MIVPWPDPLIRQQVKAEIRIELDCPKAFGLGVQIDGQISIGQILEEDRKQGAPNAAAFVAFDHFKPMHGVEQAIGFPQEASADNLVMPVVHDQGAGKKGLFLGRIGEAKKLIHVDGMFGSVVVIKGHGLPKVKLFSPQRAHREA